MLFRSELGRVRTDPAVALEPVDGGEVGRGELEAHQVEVLHDPRRGDRLGYDDPALLQVPAQDDLGGRAAEPLGDRGDGGLDEHRALGERAPGLGDDAERVVGGDDVALLQGGVELDLVDRRDGAAEGGDIEYNLSMIMDGQTGWEHPIGNVPLYGDVTTFFGMANAFYSPTFLVGGASSWNEEYWYAESDVFKDPKLQSWLPWQMLIPSTRRRMLRPATDYSFQLIARSLADIVDAGGYGAIGSHGQQHGLGSHWEVWMAATGMGPMRALEVGTLHGAKYIGKIGRAHV